VRDKFIPVVCLFTSLSHATFQEFEGTMSNSPGSDRPLFWIKLSPASLASLPEIEKKLKGITKQAVDPETCRMISLFLHSLTSGHWRSLERIFENMMSSTTFQTPAQASNKFLEAKALAVSCISLIPFPFPFPFPFQNCCPIINHFNNSRIRQHAQRCHWTPRVLRNRIERCRIVL